MLEQRSLTLLELLIKSDLITVEEIQSRTELTRRQIDYDLVKINEWLSERQYPKIEKLRRKGIAVPLETKLYIIEQILEKGGEKASPAYSFGDKERMVFIYLQLFSNQEYLSLNHFIYFLNISKSTVLKDIKNLEQILIKSNIRIIYNRRKGYSLYGDEQMLRFCMMHFVMELLSNTNGSKLLDWYNAKNHLIEVKKLQLIVKDNLEKWSICNC